MGASAQHGAVGGCLWLMKPMQHVQPLWKVNSLVVIYLQNVLRDYDAVQINRVVVLRPVILN